MDNCCFNRPFDDQGQVKIRIETEAVLYIQQKLIEDKIDLVWSYMLDYENNFNPFPERRISIESWKEYSQIDIKESNELLNYAKELFESGIKAKDALHIASAVTANCEYFITTDEDIIKKLINYKKIKIINPTELIIKENI